jgi:serine phosphatase RsbU (regulator of sigma subunit)/DNA-binding response OmpR family regulator
MNPQEAVTVMIEPPPRGDDEVSILIVDDEPGNRETLADIFAEMGFHTESAGTGQQALEKVHERFYNVAILDIRLPDMYGTELLPQIKEVQPHTTCIMVTGYASVQTSVTAINSGAYAYIVKPLDIDHVSNVIRQALDQQRLLFENARLLRELRALSEVTDTALSTLNLNELLRSLLRSFIHYLGADAGAILLIDESGQRLEEQTREEWGAGRFSLALGEAFAERVAVAEGPVVVENDPLSDRAASSSFRGPSIRTMMGVPLRAKERTIGVALVDRLRPHTFSQEEIELFGVLAPRAALLIDNARLFEQEQRLLHRFEKLALTEQRNAEELRILYDVAQALVENMGLPERLASLAGQLVKVMRVDRCVIWLNERGVLVPGALLGVSTEEGQAWRNLRIEKEEYGPALQAALDQGEPQVVPEATMTSLVHLELPAELNVRSVLLLPMVLSRRVIGMAWLDQPGESREFSREQLRLGQLIAGQAAVAIENAQIFEQERNIASTLQQSFLPPAPVEHPLFDVRCRYVPAHAAAQVGGDYYDFIELPDEKLGVVMGDVCGKGVTAAVFTAMAKYILRAYAVEDPGPASVITRLNRSLYSQMSEDCMFITMVYGVLDTRTGDFTYVNAAHPPPLIYHPDRDEVSELATTGGMVGALPAMDFQQRRARLKPGGVLLLYTDGVTEARTAHEMLEIQGVQAVLRRAAGGSAQSICDLVYRRALEFSGGSLKDDVAIVAIRARGPGG